jgi:hypothetical protein
LNHLWQRFLLASSLIVGLFIGVAATVFGYSNLSSVDVHWSVFHINGVPLWTVAVVPLALFLIAGTLYHWMDGLHHFTEHMRHRRRVHELEAEVASLRAHLDQLLEMPDHSTSPKLTARKETSVVTLPAADERVTDLAPTEPEPAVELDPEPAHKPAEVVPIAQLPEHVANNKKPRSATRKRVTLEVAGNHARPDRSGSHVEGLIGDSAAPKPADPVEQEA